MFTGTHLYAEEKPLIAFIGYTNGFWQVWLMDKEGQNQKQITKTPYDKNRVSWYPDGEHLLVNSFQGKLEKVSTKSGKSKEIILPLKGMVDAVISPDGKQVAFSLSTAQGVDANNIWLVNENGKNLKKLTRMSQIQHEPLWSNDSKWLYFLSLGEDKQAHDIWRVNISDQSTEQITVAQIYQFEISISKDDELAFSSNRSGNYEIWKMKPGKSAIKLTNHPMLDGHPNWSPDSQYILFESNRDGGVTNIWKMNSNGENLKQLTYFERGAKKPVWFTNKGIAK